MPKIFLVGGCVRDGILGRTPKDHDYVVVGASIEWMLERGFKQVGAAFPVFLHPETGDEYALARREKKVAPGYTGFEFEFGPHVTLEDDLLRRDLTINAIAKDIETGELICFNRGIEDLHEKIIRHTSEAFAEDPLRVLRVARFAARYGFTIDPSTFDLCKRLVESKELDALSPNRIWVELEKLLGEDDPMPGLIFLRDVGALQSAKLKPLFERSIIDQTDFEKCSFAKWWTAKEKVITFISFDSLTPKQISEATIPLHYAKMFEFCKGLNDLAVNFTTDEVIKFFNKHREVIKNTTMTEDCKKYLVKTNFAEASRLEDDYLFGMAMHMFSQFSLITKIFEELKKLDFTKITEGLTTSEIKEAVKNAQIEAVASVVSR